MQALPGNRAALSLLGHCYYHQGQFESACQAYELLVRHHPHLAQYRLYHAQCLFKGGQLAEALRVLDVVEGHEQHVKQQRMAITYASEQYAECRQMLRAWPEDTAESMMNEGCMLYHESKVRWADPCRFLVNRLHCSTGISSRAQPCIVHALCHLDAVCHALVWAHTHAARSCHICRRAQIASARVAHAATQNSALKRLRSSLAEHLLCCTIRLCVPTSSTSQQTPSKS